jgi:hypothetical protein
LKKQSRKNQERSLTYRLYSLRLVENQFQMQLNKQTLSHFIQNLLQRIGLISELNQTLEQHDKSIVLSEKAKIYLDESLTLHNEPSKTKNSSLANQHAVYSLHERHAQYLDYAQNLEKVYELVDGLVDNIESLFRSTARLGRFMSSFQLLVNYLEPEFKATNSLALLNAILIFDGKLNSMLTERQESEALAATNYTAIDEFLGSIGQGQIVRQCETLHAEIAESRNERKLLASAAFDLIARDLDLFTWFGSELSVSSATNGDQAKLLEWLREIRCSKNPDSNYGLNSEQFRTVCMNYVQLYNPKLATKLVEKGELRRLFSYNKKNKSLAVESKFLSLNAELNFLDTRLTNVNIRKITAESQYSIALLQIQESCCTEKSFVEFIEQEISGGEDAELDVIFTAMDFVWIQFFNDNLQKWLAMESVSLSVSKEQLVVLNSQDGDWFLEEILSLMLNCGNLAKLMRSLCVRYGRLSSSGNSSNDIGSSLEIFDSLASVFLNLKELIYGYERGQFESLFKAVVNDPSGAARFASDLQAINVDEFFTLISDESFNAQSFSQNTACMEKLSDMKAKYAAVMASGNSLSLVLVELEKTFSRVDVEFEKCLQFCRLCYEKQSFINQTFFALTPNLVRNLFIFYA